MKKISALIIGIVSVLIFASCENNNYHSPEITIYNYLVNDTVPLHNDTLFVGDTLQLAAYLNPYYNTITKFEVTVDRSYIKDSIFAQDDYEAVCDTARSDKSTGSYIMANLTAGESMLIRKMLFAVIAAPASASSSTVTISLSLTSDVSIAAEYNPYVLQVPVVVVEKPTTSESTTETETTTE